MPYHLGTSSLYLVAFVNRDNLSGTVTALHHHRHLAVGS